MKLSAVPSNLYILENLFFVSKRKWAKNCTFELELEKRALIPIAEQRHLTNLNF